MENTIKQKRFTLSLPEPVHKELTRIATARGISSRDVVIQSLKLGIIAFETEDDPSKELLIRENQEDGTEKETRLIII